MKTIEQIREAKAVLKCTMDALIVGKHIGCCHEVEEAIISLAVMQDALSWAIGEPNVLGQKLDSFQSKIDNIHQNLTK